ncbi:hypothetical protein BJ742DRAFT_773807 [Cladochytrium replicatum]|nr:hypothetical protein BJ742DRAFT_773807 [Cladochytrium replicatum]
MEAPSDFTPPKFKMMQTASGYYLSTLVGAQLGLQLDNSLESYRIVSVEGRPLLTGQIIKVGHGGVTFILPEDKKTLRAEILDTSGSTDGHSSFIRIEHTKDGSPPTEFPALQGTFGLQFLGSEMSSHATFLWDGEKPGLQKSSGAAMDVVSFIRSLASKLSGTVGQDFFKGLEAGSREIAERFNKVSVGCRPYTPAQRRAVAGRIVVVRRGGCLFIEKALNGEMAGAAGVIVVSDRDEIFPMALLSEPERLRRGRDAVDPSNVPSWMIPRISGVLMLTEIANSWMRSEGDGRSGSWWTSEVAIPLTVFNRAWEIDAAPLVDVEFTYDHHIVKNLRVVGLPAELSDLPFGGIKWENAWKSGKLDFWSRHSLSGHGTKLKGRKVYWTGSVKPGMSMWCLQHCARERGKVRSPYGFDEHFQSGFSGWDTCCGYPY